MKVSIKSEEFQLDKTTQENAESFSTWQGSECIVANCDYRQKTLLLSFKDQRHMVSAAQLIIAVAALYGHEYVSSALR